MILYMSIVSLPLRRMYWSGMLCQSEANQDVYDNLYKICHILDTLNEKFQQAAEMERCLAVDEMMIPFKGRHSLKVDMMKKQKKWGYKV